MNSAEKRWQALEQVANRCRRIRHALTTLAASVPDIDLWLKSLDSVTIGLRKLLVCAVGEHEVLHETLRTTENICHVAVGLGHRGKTFGLALLGDEVGLSCTLLGEIFCFSLTLGDDEVRLGFALFRLEVCLSIAESTESSSFSFGVATKVSRAAAITVAGSAICCMRSRR